MPANYWQSLPKDLPPLYNGLADYADVTIVRAAHDNVVGDTDFSKLDNQITVLTIPGDHNFSGNNRPELLATVAKLLAPTAS